jgi:hypothetical protein
VVNNVISERRKPLKVLKLNFGISGFGFRETEQWLKIFTLAEPPMDETPKW